MNKIILFAALALSFSVRAADDPNVVISDLIDKATKAGWTAESMAVGLDRLDRWYQKNQADPKFRRDLNGEVLSVEIDTNALTKTYTYANGTTYVEKFSVVTPRPLEEKLTAAELKARREEAARLKAEAEAQARRERIAVLEDETQFKAETESLMRSKGYPEELARLLLQHELNQLKGPVTINATITPQ